MRPQDELRLLTDHYDALIAENNDPVLDPPTLAAYMERWDGAPFMELLSLDGTQSVLEPGVGTGRLARRVAPRCRHLTGIDLSPATVARARAHLSGYGNTTLLCGDFMTFPFRETFDRVYASLFLFHIRDKAVALARMASLLAPGGRLVLSVSLERAASAALSGRPGSDRLAPARRRTGADRRGSGRGGAPARGRQAAGQITAYATHDPH